jgi:hypothetical protein
MAPLEILSIQPQPPKNYPLANINKKSNPKTIDGFQGALKLDLKPHINKCSFSVSMYHICKPFKLFSVYRTSNFHAMNRTIHNPLESIINFIHAINIIHYLFRSQASNYKISYAMDIFKDP